MLYEWLAKEQSPHLILFFNGWGMTKNSIAHLTAENTRSKRFDCLHFYHYQEKALPQFDFSGYEKMTLIAWSMGVYMSSQLQVPLTQKIAFCGTGSPVDKENGIAPKIYQLTIDSFSEKTLPLFSKKIGFQMDTSCSSQELKQELIAIQQYDFPAKNIFDCAFIADEDKIFPPQAQEHYWNTHAKKIIHLASRHYPFHLFTSWKEILTQADK